MMRNLRRSRQASRHRAADGKSEYALMSCNSWTEIGSLHRNENKQTNMTIIGRTKRVLLCPKRLELQVTSQY